MYLYNLLQLTIILSTCRTSTLCLNNVKYNCDKKMKVIAWHCNGNTVC